MTSLAWNTSGSNQVPNVILPLSACRHWHYSPPSIIDRHTYIQKTKEDAQRNSVSMTYSTYPHNDDVEVTFTHTLAGMQPQLTFVDVCDSYKELSFPWRVVGVSCGVFDQSTTQLPCGFVVCVGVSVCVYVCVSVCVYVCVSLRVSVCLCNKVSHMDRQKKAEPSRQPSRMCKYSSQELLMCVLSFHLSYTKYIWTGFYRAAHWQWSSSL